MAKIIECVPNFSEGRDKNVIDQIVKAIASAKVTVNGNEEGVKVLDVDPGEATNRTVVTFVGSPEAVLEAAFQGVKCSGEVIDMRHHHGAHPRSGACDVLHGHEEVSGSHVDGPALGHGLVVLLRSEVRCLGRIGDLLGEGQPHGARWRSPSTCARRAAR